MAQNVPQMAHNVPQMAQNVPQTAAKITPAARGADYSSTASGPPSLTREGLGDASTEGVKISEAKESLTDVQRKERATERAKAWIEYEKQAEPTAKELNTARSAVKNFDELENRKRLAIIRTIRSAEESGNKIDGNTLRGVVNLMSARTSRGRSMAGNLEVRFADNISQSGLYTRAEGTPLILINSKSDTPAAMRTTVAHELVHYLENRLGYKELAAYVWQTATKEEIAEARADYESFYKENKIEYTEEDIQSEIVARLVGERLQSEKFLKRYAEKDASMGAKTSSAQVPEAFSSTPLQS